MAFKFTVDHQNISAVIDDDLYQALRALSTHELISLADIYLDPNSLNRYFTAQTDSPHALTVTATENLTYSLAKALTDIASVAESHVMSISKGASETATISESFARTLSWARTFTETPSVAEAIALALSHPESDSTSVGESHAMSVGQASSDAFGFNETTVFSLGIATNAVNNVATMSESHAINLSKILADSATISESFFAVLVGLPSSVLNERVLNTSTLNS
jgi:hypothetical protein